MRKSGRCRTIRRISFHIIVALVVVTILLVQLISDVSQRKLAPQSLFGVMDLRSWDFAKDGSVSLKGKWEFTWKELLRPDQFSNPMKERQYVQVPTSWNQMILNDWPLSGTGYATYRIQILKDKEARMLGIWLPSIYTSYKVWMNGQPFVSEGKVGDEPAKAVPSMKQRLAMMVSDEEVLDIVIQVSNYSYVKGGMWQAPEIGSTEQMIRKSKMETVRDAVLFGCLFIVGLYHLGMFLERRQDVFTFHFGLLCIAISLRMLAVGDMLLYNWFPWIPWNSVIRLDYCLTICAVICGVSYVKTLFINESHRMLYRFVLIMGLVLIGLTLSLSTIVFTSWLLFYQIYIVIGMLFMLSVTIKAVLRQHLGATIALIGFTVFCVLIINDLLYYQELAPIRDLSPIGLVICVFMQSLMISMRYSNAMEEVESVSCELRELNTGLEQRIQLRTGELLHMNENLEQKNKELERMENSRRHLLTNISHDLRTPMTLIRGYLEALHDDVINEPAEQKKYVKLMLNKINSLNHLIGDLFELSKLEAREVQVTMEDMLLEHFISHIEEHYELELRRRGFLFACYNLTYRDAPPVSLNLRIDIDRMTQVFDNLIYNAVKFTPAGGTISIRVQYVAYKSCIHLEVTDTGIGVDSEDLPYIFDRFYKKDKSRNSSSGGSGLGLSIAKEIVELHHGSIWATSMQGQGCTFHIELPARMQ